MQRGMESAGKRRRAAQEKQEPEYVNLRCMDDHDNSRLQHLSVKLLKHFNCRLYREVSTDKPKYCETHKVFYYDVMMTRAMLQTFARALTHQTLSLAEGVSYNEAADTFTYECIDFGSPPPGEWNLAMVRSHPSSIGWDKRAEAINQELRLMCEHVANAIADWPRLLHCLDAAHVGQQTKFAVNATRAWVCFIHKPEVKMDREDAILSLVRKWPSWLQGALTAIGSIHYKLSKEGELDAKARNMDAFGILAKSVSGDMMGKFFSMRCDVPRAANIRDDLRKAVTRGIRFAEEMRHIILEYSAAQNSQQSVGQSNLNAAVAANAAAAQAHAAQAAATNAAGQTATASLSSGSTGQATLHQVGISAVASSKADQHNFARGCVGMAEQILHDSPNLSIIFSGRCLDSNDKSMERTLLAKALSQRGIKVCRWDNPSSTGEFQAFKPLLFPAYWVPPELMHSERGRNVWASVLLDFSGK